MANHEKSTELPLKKARELENARYEAAVAHNITAQVPLLTLPAEIRNHIWELVLPKHSGSLLARSGSHRLYPGRDFTGTPFVEPSLLRTCRLIREDAVGLFYDSQSLIHNVASTTPRSERRYKSPSPAAMHTFMRRHDTFASPVVRYVRSMALDCRIIFEHDCPDYQEFAAIANFKLLRDRYYITVKAEIRGCEHPDEVVRWDMEEALRDMVEEILSGFGRRMEKLVEAKCGTMVSFDRFSYL